jgi:hypothetical protein
MTTHGTVDDVDDCSTGTSRLLEPVHTKLQCAIETQQDAPLVHWSLFRVASKPSSTITRTNVVAETKGGSRVFSLPPSTSQKLLRMSFLDFQRDKRATAPSEIQDSSSVISAVPVVRTDGQRQAQQAEVVTANDVLARAFDATRLHPLAGIGDQGQLDYLLLDDDKLNSLPGAQTALPSRGWTDDLCYGTGTTYLTGEPASH